MWMLLVASLMWALSFGLIKYTLGGVNPMLVAWIRLMLSFVVFVPFFRLRYGKVLSFRLAVIGAVQYGVMYAAYLHAYRYLQSYEVVLFTVLTPLYVTAVSDIAEKRFHRLFFLCSMMASGAGALICLGWGSLQRIGYGFLLMQFSNIFFALGQVAYRNIMKDQPIKNDLGYYSTMYGGAVLILSVILPFSVSASDFVLSPNQWLVLLYLGVVPSGVAFFLWNIGAKSCKSGTLAVLNNAKIPMGVAASMLVFGEKVDLGRLAVGALLMLLAMFVTEWAGDKSAGSLRT